MQKTVKVCFADLQVLGLERYCCPGVPGKNQYSLPPGTRGFTQEKQIHPRSLPQSPSAEVQHHHLAACVLGAPVCARGVFGRQVQRPGGGWGERVGP